MNRCPRCHTQLPEIAAGRTPRRCPACGAALAVSGAPRKDESVQDAVQPVAPGGGGPWAERLAAVLLDDVRLYRPELLEDVRDGLPGEALAAELAAAWRWWRERAAGAVPDPAGLFRRVAAARLGVAWPGDDHKAARR